MLDRTLTLLGGSMAALGGLFLVLWGSALVDVFGALDRPRPGLGNDLATVVLAAACLGLGLGLVSLEFALTPRVRALSGFGKGALVLSGLLTAVGGVLLALAFSSLLKSLAVVAASSSSPQAELLRNVLAAEATHVSGGLFTVLSGQIVLSISLWSLFWARVTPRRRSPLAWPLAGTAILSAALSGLLFCLAAQSGTALVELFSGRGMPRPADLVTYLSRSLRFSLTGSACLIVYGLATVIQGIVFPVHHDVAVGEAA
jgi:hypothetical protein